MNSATAYPCIGPRIRVFRISMSSVPGSSSPELGLGSRISELLDPEVGHNRGQIFVKQPGFAPSLAPAAARPQPKAAENRQVEGEDKYDLAGDRDHHG